MSPRLYMIVSCWFTFFAPFPTYEFRSWHSPSNCSTPSVLAATAVTPCCYRSFDITTRHSKTTTDNRGVAPVPIAKEAKVWFFKYILHAFDTRGSFSRRRHHSYFIIVPAKIYCQCLRSSLYYFTNRGMLRFTSLSLIALKQSPNRT
jgi:hypothetical protein